MLAEIIGGLGLFLLGMTLLTDGLHTLSSRALRRSIARYAGTPLSGAITGTVSTAIIQSSSATTLATLGLVGAGVMTFQQAWSVVLGANLGTTATGWLVALIGFKLKLTTLTLPAIAIGVLLKMFGRGRLPAAGMALAGFGLIFVGIDILRIGMEGLEHTLTPGTFPTDNISSRILIVGIGVALTLVTQSSSAGMAMALAALYADRINFTQAACLVIGFDLGTTVTAAIAAIGGSIETKRTAASHVIFNVFTALGAFLFLPLFAWLASDALGAGLANDPELFLVGFHTTFNLLSVAVALPFTARFTHAITRFFPAKSAEPIRHLDITLRNTPDEALNAAHRALREISQELLTALCERLQVKEARHKVLRELEIFERSTEQSEDFLGSIASSEGNPPLLVRHVAGLHATDHLERLIARAREENLQDPLLEDDIMKEHALLVQESLKTALIWLENTEAHAPAEELQALSQTLTENRQRLRPELLARIARASLDPERADRLLESLHWLERVAYHVWRFIFHLQSMRSAPIDSTHQDNKGANGKPVRVNFKAKDKDAHKLLDI